MLNVSSSNLTTLWFIPQPYPQTFTYITSFPQSYPHYPQFIQESCV